MLFIYRILINLILILSPIILIFRFFKRKEDTKRFKEKFCYFSQRKRNGKLIWFHGASVGELQSIIPLLERLEKNKDISQILITSNTLSSSKIIENYRFRKIIHQFFPIDTNFFSKKFVNYWKPSVAFFIDSEIWPNMIYNLNKKNIPTILLNGRITRKTFNKWRIFPNFAKEIFSKFNLCLPSSNESKSYLKKLGNKKVKLIGNIKFTQSENEKISIDYDLKNFIKFKKTWCASSTHDTEEIFCGLVHQKLKRKHKDLLTIIIPRHIERVANIEDQLNKLKLKTHLHLPKKKYKKILIYILLTLMEKQSLFTTIVRIYFLGVQLLIMEDKIR